MTTPIFVDQVAAALEGLLTIEETAGPTQCLADLEARRARRKAIDESIGAIEDTAARLRHRASRLSRLPDGEVIGWAQAALRFPTLPFLKSIPMGFLTMLISCGSSC
jgi:hypothetical protein